MNKKGYTLTEALVAMSIVGILAAVLMPLVNKMRPDPEKMAYLKFNQELVETINTVVSTPSLYPMLDENGVNYRFAPLLNTVGIDDGNNNYGDIDITGGSQKLCDILFLAFNGGTNNCNGNFVQNGQNNFAPSFRTKNGMDIFITTDINPYRTDLYVDVNGGSGQNCFWDDNDNCTKPDRFKFMIAADGRVFAADPQGRAYLENPTNVRRNSQAINEDFIDDGILNALADEFRYQIISDQTGTTIENVSGGEIGAGNLPNRTPTVIETDSGN